MTKRVLAIIVAVALCLSLVPVGTVATEKETFIVGETKENVTIEQKGGVSYSFTPQVSGMYSFIGYADSITDLGLSVLDGSKEIACGFTNGGLSRAICSFEAEVGKEYDLYVGGSTIFGEYFIVDLYLDYAVMPTDIYLSESSHTGFVGESFYLYHRYTPDNSIQESYNWSSSNSAVATVTEDGYVELVALGEATITIESESGLLDSCNIIVRAPESVAFDYSNKTGYPGTTEYLSYSFSPYGTEEDVEIVSSNPSVASVSQNDWESWIISYHEVGTTELVLTSVNGLTASCSVTVREMESVVLDQMISLTVQPGDRLCYLFTPEENAEYAFFIEDSYGEDLVGFGDGWFKTGKYIQELTANSQYTLEIWNKNSYACDYTVGIKKTVPVERVELRMYGETAPDVWDGYIEDWMELRVVSYPRWAANEIYEWTTSDSEVASMSGSGNYRDISMGKPGTATITVTSESGASDSIELNVALPKIVESWNVVIKNNMNVRFYLNEILPETATIDVSIGESLETYHVSDLEKYGNMSVVSIDMAAAQLEDDISLHITDGQYINESVVYNVRQYCDTLLEDESHSKYHQLLKEMLNYGAMAQLYFNHNAENLANEGITGVAVEEVPETCDELYVDDRIDGVDFYGASLVYRNRIALRYYFTGDISDCSFTKDGDVCTPVSKDGMHYIEITDILPQNLDKQIKVTVKDADESQMTVSYSPMNYIVRMYAGGNENLKNLLRAIYNYHLVAKNITLGKIEYLSIYISDSNEEVKTMCAYSNEDGSTYIEYISDIVKKGTIDGDAMAIISKAFATSELEALNERSEENSEGLEIGSMYIGFEDGDVCYADFYGKIPEEFLNGCAVMEECFAKLTADMPEYIPVPLETGEIAESDKNALNTILSNMELWAPADTFAISGVAKDQYFAETLGLSSAEGIVSGLGFAPMMLMEAYRLRIVTLEKSSAAYAVAADFENNIDWFSWIFVFPSDALIAIKDNQVLCLMGSDAMYTETASAIQEAGWTVYKTLQNPNM